ncbi:MAG: hypothetical protein ACO3RU_07915, partial [Planctomycetota bacterium]
MRTRLLRVLATVLLASTAARMVPAQETRITSNERFVFVVRGDELLQFDATTLALVNRTRLPAPAAQKAETQRAPAIAKATVQAEAKAIPPKAVIQAVERGLQWIASSQAEDGRWDADSANSSGGAVHDVGVTGLALLALLGQGNTPKSGPHAEAVAKGLAWLMGQQDPETGLVGTTSS